MNKKIDIIEVPLSTIDVSSEHFDKYLFSYKRKSHDLKDSIIKTGLICPIALCKPGQKDAKHEIVCGYQRVKVFQELGKASICAQIVENADDETLLLASLNDNKFSRGFNDVEKAIAINKFMAAGYSREKVATDLSKLIDIPPKTEIVDKYLALLSMENEIKDCVATGEMEMEKALLLAQFDGTDRCFVFRELFKDAALNINESKETIKSLIDLKDMNRQEITEVLTSDEVKEILGDKTLNRKNKGQKVYALIKRMRYPIINSQEAKFEEARKSLGLDNNIRINHSRFFEGNDIQINIKATNEKKLLESLEKLLANVKNDKFKQLFSVSKCEDIVLEHKS